MTLTGSVEDVCWEADSVDSCWGTGLVTAGPVDDNCSGVGSDCWMGDGCGRLPECMCCWRQLIEGKHDLRRLLDIR